MKRLSASLATIAVLAALAGCGGDDESSTTTTTTDTTVSQPEPQPQPQPDPQPPPPPPPPGPELIRITVRNGVPAGGVVRVTVDRGDRVVLVVRSDVADEIHLHGYDVSRDVAAGGTARLPFRATIPGRFEVELEERHVPIAEVTVRP